MDFQGDANALRVLVEGERLSYGHLYNPAFATEISKIDPLPHQRDAVYKHMLPQSRLRYLLADDAGAGKTIMTGLYVRESLTRRTIRRILIVAPAGLMGNWHRELLNLFSLRFHIVTGADAKRSNPFIGPESDQVVTSLDSLRSPRLFERLRVKEVEPYDLVVFDEAHKLSARQDPDGTFRPTGRYRLAEAIAGVRDIPDEWQIPWAAEHLLLLTATPHTGKNFPYYCLWRLLEPDIFASETAFEQLSHESRSRYFIRRIKEEMVDFKSRPLFPERLCDTVSYDLIQGESGEQALYDQTTAYIRHSYNQARLLNKQAARFAMTVFQRRLASSTRALLCSFRNRCDKLDRLIDDIRSGRLSEEAMQKQQSMLDRKIREEKLIDILDAKTADEESIEKNREEHEEGEAEAMGAFLSIGLSELIEERERLEELIHLAENVHDSRQESKFNRMRELLDYPEYRDQKVIIYTEHKDTLDFLEDRLQEIGYADQVAYIHGGLDFKERDAQVERFRRPHDQEHGGARFFIGTDAAAEGINLQFCGILINYDIPWNPARLEQRMGRIHRYGQKRDKVSIVNLVAGQTREGRVVKILLDKLEEIRKQLGSDKVFDVVGRIFEGVSLIDYIQRTFEFEDESKRQSSALEDKLTVENVRAIEEREEGVYGKGGDVKSILPQMLQSLDIEEKRHLLPGYIRRYLEDALPLIGMEIADDVDGCFSLQEQSPGALESLQPLDPWPESARRRFTVHRPKSHQDAVFLHPGEPVFDRLSNIAKERCRSAGRRGAIFTDASATSPYLFHVARISVVRTIDPSGSASKTDEILEQCLVGIRQDAEGNIDDLPVEHLLLLTPAPRINPMSAIFLDRSDDRRSQGQRYIENHLLGERVIQRQKSERALSKERQENQNRAFDLRESELAAARKRWTQKSRQGDRKAKSEIDKIRDEQKGLNDRRTQANDREREKAERIAPGKVKIIATALVQPSMNPEDIKARDLNIERVAMEMVIAYERAHGAEVIDVSTPEKARLAGLSDYPGFDLQSKRRGEERDIEVKGRVGTGDVELTENEWARAGTLRKRYWLYAVFDCGTQYPRLERVQDPFRELVAKPRGVSIKYQNIVQAAEPDE
ncbi:MAG: DUF3883 domain-containing protein [Ectothiorhodospiraceae bacterium AqS1]|nr:DUF3883 domain-containing protein [Ectothiorhodospiraceae bacterium AqS1]